MVKKSWILVLLFISCETAFSQSDSNIFYFCAMCEMPNGPQSYYYSEMAEIQSVDPDAKFMGDEIYHKIPLDSNEVKIINGKPYLEFEVYSDKDHDKKFETPYYNKSGDKNRIRLHKITNPAGEEEYSIFTKQSSYNLVPNNLNEAKNRSEFTYNNKKFNGLGEILAKGNKSTEVKKRLQEYLDQAAEKMKKGENVTIVLSGHGDSENKSNGVVKGSAGETGMILPSGRLTSDELAKMWTESQKKHGVFGKHGPPFARFVGEHCYGGAYLSFGEKFSNSCSSAFSDHITAVDARNQYPQKFWGYAARMKKERGITPSLKEAFYASYYSGVDGHPNDHTYTDTNTDTNYEANGQLSSRYYINKLMGNNAIGNDIVDSTTVADKWGVYANSLTMNATSAQLCTSIASMSIVSTSELDELYEIASLKYIPKGYKNTITNLKASQKVYLESVDKYEKIFKGAYKIWKEDKNMTNQMRKDLKAYLKLENILSHDKSTYLEQPKKKAAFWKKHPELAKYLDTKGGQRLFSWMKELDRLQDNIHHYYANYDAYQNMKEIVPFLKKFAGNKEVMDKLEQIEKCQNSPL